ncbi:hypothetical protein NBH19_08930 [Rhizobium sp. S95]|uniref:Uncharacterized protein n=1 Tax=Ciceribacter sichuanensis TaxID=2949647 RepID=A0AAJ1BZ62_9HYPH|nr:MULTISPECIES: hypothetical protein [unclassified Ciceribacter]MCM2396201.1 hypothetical protein [Ciceribacter sp. S95]MCO5957648.1 hypothetical protein [Ciceribacter sp. S101]
MTVLSVQWADRNLAAYGSRLEELKRQFPLVLPRIVNQVGNRAKTVVVRELTKQTGLPRATIVKAIGNPSVARPGKLNYDMVTRGGNIRLKYLRPKETAAGVIARPFGKATLYPGTFMRGGQFPDRKDVEKWDGHAFFRNGKGRHIAFARSGVIIPTEMTTKATAAAFLRIAGPLLEQRIEAALTKLVP